TRRAAALKCLQLWREKAAVAQQQRGRCRCAARWQQRQQRRLLSTCLNAWKHKTVSEIRVTLEQGVQELTTHGKARTDALEKQLLKCTEFAAERMLRGRAFRAWRVIVGRHGKTQRAGKVLGCWAMRLGRGQLAMGFRKLREGCERAARDVAGKELAATKAGMLDMEARNERLAMVAGRRRLVLSQYQAISRAFSSWSSFSQRRKTGREVLEAVAYG
ncbi:unnamed protein product, partial [Chrysoparadoxa australica]